jgi:hypothetical protein
MIVQTSTFWVVAYIKIEYRHGSTEGRTLSTEIPETIHVAGVVQPPNNAAVNGAAAPDLPQPEASIFSSVLGQATAVLTLAIGVIYAAGELALGLKIWYAQVPWTPVLDGMPKNFILVNAIDDLIPAVLATVPIYLLYSKLVKPNEPEGQHGTPSIGLLRQARVALVGAALAALVTFLFLVWTAGYFSVGVLRPEWEIILASFIMSLVTMGLGATAISVIGGRMESPLARHCFGAAVVVIALVPCTASAYAAFPLPAVHLCGPPRPPRPRRPPGASGPENYW